MDWRLRDPAGVADPYELCLGVLVERFCFTIARDEPPGAIVVERRGRQLDRELVVAWQSLRLNGTRYVSPETITRRIASLETRGKCAEDAGLQLADLVVSPIARAVIGHRADRQMRLHDTAGVQPTTRHGRDGESAPCGEDRDRVST